MVLFCFLHRFLVADHQADLANVLVHVDTKSRTISPGPKFLQLFKELPVISCVWSFLHFFLVFFSFSNYNVKENAFIPVVSVVGGSGVGKSTFVRQCIKEGFPKPLAAPAQSSASTSADIHAYIGNLPTQTPIDILLLDSEGI